MYVNMLWVYIMNHTAALVLNNFLWQFYSCKLILLLGIHYFEFTHNMMYIDHPAL